jgi:DNA-binding transcriptional ArsR family regulator
MDRTDERAVKIFKALSNPYRFQLIKILLEDSKNVSTMAEELRVESETISNHLRFLRNCELVTNRREGNKVYYSVNRPKVVRKLLDIVPDLHRDED